MLMLVSVTLTLMQGHSGLAEENNSTLNYLDKYGSNKHAQFNCFTWLWLWSRPDMTSVVDWALKANYLSILILKTFIWLDLIFPSLDFQREEGRSVRSENTSFACKENRLRKGLHWGPTPNHPPSPPLPSPSPPSPGSPLMSQHAHGLAGNKQNSQSKEKTTPSVAVLVVMFLVSI